MPVTKKAMMPMQKKAEGMKKDVKKGVPAIMIAMGVKTPTAEKTKKVIKKK